jgi:hypothetical protein
MNNKSKINTNGLSVFQTLLTEWRYSIAIRNWRTSIFRPIKRTVYNLTLKPYYYLKWFELVDAIHEAERTIFKRWKLRDPLNIEATVRTNVNDIHSRKDCPNDDSVIKDRVFKKYLWSKQFKYVETQYQCLACLFEPVEKFYSSGGDEGGMHFGSKASWNEIEEKGGSLCL